jgi:hypothetical protein
MSFLKSIDSLFSKSMNNLNTLADMPSTLLTTGKYILIGIGVLAGGGLIIMLIIAVKGQGPSMVKEVGNAASKIPIIPI